MTISYIYYTKRKSATLETFSTRISQHCVGILPGGVADTGASPYPTAGAGQAGVGAGPVPLTEGCRPRDPGLAMAVGETPGERPGPAGGAEVCTFT